MCYIKLLFMYLFLVFSRFYIKQYYVFETNLLLRKIIYQIIALFALFC